MKKTHPSSAHTPGPWHISKKMPIGADDPNQEELYVYSAKGYIATVPNSLSLAWMYLVRDATANARLIGAAPDLREASQKLYDALQRYLMGTADSELPEELVQGMDELEAAWHKADGAIPEPEDQ